MNTATETQIPLSQIHAAVLAVAMAAASSAFHGSAQAITASHAPGQVWTKDSAQKVSDNLAALETILLPHHARPDPALISDTGFSEAYKEIAKILPRNAHQELFEGLGVASSFEQDWNGYGASAANVEAIRAAELLIPTLPDDLSNPLVGIAEEGAIYLKFSHGINRYVLTVEPRKLHLLVDNGRGKYSYIDDLEFDGRSMPASIVEALAGTGDA